MHDWPRSSRAGVPPLHFTAVPDPPAGIHRSLQPWRRCAYAGAAGRQGGRSPDPDALRRAATRPARRAQSPILPPPCARPPQPGPDKDSQTLVELGSKLEMSTSYLAMVRPAALPRRREGSWLQNLHKHAQARHMHASTSARTQAFAQTLERGARPHRQNRSSSSSAATRSTCGAPSLPSTKSRRCRRRSQCSNPWARREWPAAGAAPLA